MRLRLKLQAIQNQYISPNYNYALSAAIYKLLQFGSPEYSQFLHEIGYKNAGKTYKLFSFALRFNKFKIDNRAIKLLNPFCELIISSPLNDEFIQSFVMGTFQENKIELLMEGIKTIFNIEQVESLETPKFNNSAKLIMLSPMILSTKINDNGRLYQYYLRHNDNIDEINRILNGNLVNKYELIYNIEYTGDGVRIKWDSNYIAKMEARKKRITKKVTIRKEEQLIIDLIGNQLPYEINGDIELIKVGYECGFGEKNSLGFGLVENVGRDDILRKQ